MPTGAKKPSILRKPKERLGLEWHRIKVRFRDIIGSIAELFVCKQGQELTLFLSLISYKFVTKPRLQLHRRKIIPEAMKLHSQMYTAFAKYVILHSPQ